MALILPDSDLPKKKGNPAWFKGMKQLQPKPSGVQEPSPRLKYLCEAHGVESILKAMKDEKYLAKTFSTYDGILIIGLANALKGSDNARESLLNRMFGKVPDKQINLNLNVDSSPEQLSDKALAMLQMLGVEDDSDLVE